jgi:hypothetical protein
VGALEKLIAADLRVRIDLNTAGATVAVLTKGGAGDMDTLLLTERAPGPAAAALPRCFRLVMHSPEVVARFALPGGLS